MISSSWKMRVQGQLTLVTFSKVFFSFAKLKNKFLRLVLKFFFFNFSKFWKTNYFFFLSQNLKKKFSRFVWRKNKLFFFSVAKFEKQIFSVCLEKKTNYFFFHQRCLHRRAKNDQRIRSFKHKTDDLRPIFNLILLRDGEEISVIRGDILVSFLVISTKLKM